MTSQIENTHRPNQAALKWILIALAAITALLSSYVAGALRPQQTVEEPICGKPECTQAENAAARAILQATVVIHVVSADRTYEDYGLGTVIGEHVVVTAKHVGAFRLVTSTDVPELRINGTTVDGPVSVRYSYLPSQGVTSGTDIMRLNLPEALGEYLPWAAHFASQAVLDSIKVGTWLTVAYYDEASGQPKVGQFKVIETGDGKVKLADPGRIINPGDSGGGVYHNGTLVGLTDSIGQLIYYKDAEGDQIDHFELKGEFWVTFIDPAFQ